MAKEYGVDRKTFYRMLKRMDICIPSGLIVPKDQEMIYDHFGKPRYKVEMKVPKLEEANV